MEVRPINAVNLKKYIRGLDVSLPYDEQDKEDVIKQVCCIIDNWPTLPQTSNELLPGWVSVEERLPTDERPVLVFVGYADTMTGFITTSSYFCFDPNPHWQWDGLVRDEQRTLFWMPLPAPPERRNSNENN